MNYQMYTSIERALGVLITGHLYLTDGSNWNDKFDRDLMLSKHVFSLYLFSTTKENVSMWMRYSAEKGKGGAMLIFSPSIMKELANILELEIDFFNDTGKNVVNETLYSKNLDYEVFLTDIVYTDRYKNGKVKLTLGDSHITSDCTILEHKNVFHKNFVWANERECWLVVRLSDDLWQRLISNNKLIARLRLSNKAIGKLKAGRLIRSPVYQDGVEYGTPSVMTGQVIWEL